MGTLIKNGTVVSSTSSQKLDVLIEGEKITQVAANIPAATHTIVDATNLLVMPGGIDVHTHLDMPFGGTCSFEGLLPYGPDYASMRCTRWPWYMSA